MLQHPINFYCENPEKYIRVNIVILARQIKNESECKTFMDVLFSSKRLKASAIIKLSLFCINALQVFAALLTCLLMSKDKGIH